MMLMSPIIMHLERRKESRISVTMKKKIDRSLLKHEKQLIQMKGEMNLKKRSIC